MFASWLRSLRRKSASNRSVRRADRFSRLPLELLEDRVVPTFAVGTPIDIPGITQSGTVSGVVTGDFNNDGKADIAVGSGLNAIPGFVSVQVSQGDGTFQSAGSGIPIGGTANHFIRSLTAADLDQDGWLDIITANF